MVVSKQGIGEREAMTIAEVSDADLSRWIASRFEPTLMICEHYVSLWGPHKGTKYFNTAFDVADDGDTLINLRWEPRDMVNDPAMTVMLLEKMTLAHLMFLRSTNMWRCCADGREQHFVHSEKLGRAVAEAFALANGWTK